MNHEPEDLPEALTNVPSRAGEQARMKKRVQSSRSCQGLGDFLFSPCSDELNLRDRFIVVAPPAVSSCRML